MNFALVAAATPSLGLGKSGSIPWHLPGDLKFFRNLTANTQNPKLQNAVIMGRKTWESIPPKYRPLSKRVNIVLSSQTGKLRSDIEQQNAKVVPSFAEAVSLLSADDLSQKIEKIFVIGGGVVYEEAIKHKSCQSIFLTKIEKEFECDVFFPAINPSMFEECKGESSDTHVENGISYRFLHYERKKMQSDPTPSQSSTTSSPVAGASPATAGSAPSGSARNPSGEYDGVLAVTQEPQSPLVINHEEQQYLDLVSDIIENGVLKGDRTGTGTLSKFGCSMRFSLRDDVFPLLTTKRVFWRGVAEELLWFISGSTNANLLSEKGIRIWDGNGSREFLDNLGFQEREVGDLGPVYGFQWRHFGAKYVDMHTDYKGQGEDQLQSVINKIKANPNDRRIVLNAWNAADLKLMALPPCHIMCQFYVANGELSCLMYQRSCDMGLGVPFNIASYALLTRLIAQVCDLKPGEFIHCLGDAHVYTNHVEPLKIQLERTPRAFPTLTINPKVKDIDSFKMSDFTLSGYSPHKKIAMKMAV